MPEEAQRHTRTVGQDVSCATFLAYTVGKMVLCIRMEKDRVAPGGDATIRLPEHAVKHSPAL